MLRTFPQFYAFALMLLVPAAAGAAEETDSTAAVVKVGGCSGVCVHPDGIVLSAKHCGLGETERVRFASGQAWDARRIYVDPAAEGVVALRCEPAGKPYPFAPVAAQVAPAGSEVWSAGFPGAAGGRMQVARGKLLGGTVRTLIEDGEPRGNFRANDVDFVTAPGWSGGPLFDERGAVIGVLTSGNATQSSFVSFAATQRAYQAASKPAANGAAGAAQPAAEQPAKTQLWAFGAKWCPPCRAFDADVDGGKWGQVISRSEDGRRVETEQLVIVHFDIDDPRHLAKLRDIQAILLKATGKTYDQHIPAFYVPGRDAMQIGYASTTGCFLIDGLKSIFSAPSMPIPPTIAAVEIDLGDASPKAETSGAASPETEPAPEKYSRLKPAEPERDPVSTPFVPAEPEPANGLFGKIDAALEKAESALAKVRKVEAAIKGQPKEPAGEAKEEEPAGWTLLGLLTAIVGFWRKWKAKG